MRTSPVRGGNRRKGTGGDMKEQLLVNCGGPHERVKRDFPVGGAFYAWHISDRHYLTAGLYRITRLVLASDKTEVWGVLAFQCRLSECVGLQIQNAINKPEPCGHDW